jgi:hypothetical protein
VETEGQQEPGGESPEEQEGGTGGEQDVTPGGEQQGESGGESGGAEQYGGDEDAGPAMDETQANADEERDQAEGDDPAA